MKQLVGILILATVLACGGGGGPTGPETPTEPPGAVVWPRGGPPPGYHVTLWATVDHDGNARVRVLPTAGTSADLPSLQCHLHYGGVVYGPAHSRCTIVEDGGDFYATVTGAPWTWTVEFSVVY